MVSSYEKLTAPCGLDCFNCDLFEANISPEVRRHVSGHPDIQPEKAACRGCREQDGCLIYPGQCATLECVKEKEVTFCFRCEDFPCSRLLPAADEAGKYPHNFKLYNLCRIMAVGLNAWAENEALDIRRKYFEGKFVVGKGPVVK